ncbi:MAG: helix-turn-helix domain-containing protein [Bacteroidetes bacterium]|nr:helix-turn-helix domain-containing protein [Bacteroidota bacterium]
MLTIKEVGERLNVSRQSIVNYRKRGVIKETIIQGKVYIKESDLNTFINSDPNQS